MNNDIVPPKRRPQPRDLDSNEPDSATQFSTVPPVVTTPQLPIEKAVEHDSAKVALDHRVSPGRPKRRWRIVLLAVAVVIIAAIFGWLVWFQSQLIPVNSGSTIKTTIAIEPGTSPAAIGALLKKEELIRNEFSFGLYLRVTGTTGKLQAGRHVLSQSMSVPELVEVLQSAERDEITLTFLPGNTITKHKQVFVRAGYEQQEIEAAFDKQYDHPIFAGKPATADLEGYIYGETYNFASDSSVEQILIRTFDEFEKTIVANRLVERFQQRGLSLFEGITIASIIQREEPNPDNQRQVSQVFALRLQQGMPLGSDVTYQYVADKQGIPRDPTLVSPYNTRIVTGLPPGPISSPGRSALIAAADPAPGDYLYFLSGDDDKLYLGRTLEDHERNIRDHCQKKCQIL